jgi:hypothetical protein
MDRVLVTLINRLLKLKMHVDTYTFFDVNTIRIFLIVFRALAVCMKKKYLFIYIYIYIYICKILKKTGYFNTGFVSLQYKNTKQY